MTDLIGLLLHKYEGSDLLQDRERFGKCFIRFIQLALHFDRNQINRKDMYS